jgi:GntR family transcriptional regulator, histidine utilization repressor
VTRAASPPAKFLAIVAHGRNQIETGAWAVETKVPSENELADHFGVSRMTARRALDQLALDGLIVRRRGAGSFVASNGVRSSFLVIRNVADEVAESGRAYTSTIKRHSVIRATRCVADALEIESGAEIFHSVIVHCADGDPVQLEYRYVRPDAAPGYLDADLHRETPNQYLQRCCPLARAVQELSAALPTRRECAALRIGPHDPCLEISRVTWSHAGLVSYARILCPARRYRLAGQLHFSSQLKS